MRSIIYCSLLLVLTASSNARPGKKCGGKPADVVFVLDSSSSIWPPDFKRQLKFVENVVDQFTVGFGSDETRVGVVTFSDNVHIQFYLNQYDNKVMLKRAVSSVRYLQGQTNTGDAIQMTRKVMFNTKYGARSDVDHIVIVITDGESNDAEATLREATAAKDAGIHIMAIGVGPNVDNIELHGIASSPSSQNVFRVDDYTTLDSILSTLAEQACEVSTDVPRKTTTTAPPTTATTQLITATESTTITPTLSTIASTTAGSATEKLPKGTTTTITTESAPRDQEKPTRVCGGKPADVFFLLDSSSSIWREDFKKQLSFVKDVIRTFDIGQGKTRVGVSTFSDDVHPMIDLDQYSTKEELLIAVDGVRYQSGLTYTGDAIEDMLTRVFVPGVTRRGAAHVVVVITDGISREPEKTAAQALLAQKSGIYMFAIGVGNDTDNNELKAIASDPDSKFVYNVDNYDSLKTIKDILAIQTCGVEATPSPEPETIRDQTGGCSRPSADVIFAFHSRRVGISGSRMILKLIEAIIQGNLIAVPKLRVGLLQDECLEDHGSITLSSNMDFFLGQLRSIRYSDVASLLKRLRMERFYYQDGRQQIAVLFVDDRLGNAQQAFLEAQRARYQGIEIFVVAVGNAYVESEVYTLCSVPATRHILRVPSYAKLLTIRTEIANTICIPKYQTLSVGKVQ